MSAPRGVSGRSRRRRISPGCGVRIAFGPSEPIRAGSSASAFSPSASTTVGTPCPGVCRQIARQGVAARAAAQAGTHQQRRRFAQRLDGVQRRADAAVRVCRQHAKGGRGRHRRAGANRRLHGSDGHYAGSGALSRPGREGRRAAIGGGSAHDQHAAKCALVPVERSRRREVSHRGRVDDLRGSRRGNLRCEADVERLHRSRVVDARVQHGAELDRARGKRAGRAKCDGVRLAGVGVHAGRDVDGEPQLAGNLRQRAQHLRDLAAQRRRAADAKQPIHDSVRLTYIAGKRPRVARPHAPAHAGRAGGVDQGIGRSRA